MDLDLDLYEPVDLLTRELPPEKSGGFSVT
jgi:hypothetical protein